MIRILGIGDVMCDKNLDTGIMYPGGQSLNVPVNAKIQGEEGAFMGYLGNDAVAQHILSVMDELNIDHSHCRSFPIPNHAAHYMTINDDRVFVPAPYPVHPMSRALFAMLAYEGLSDDDWVYISSYDIVHCSNDSKMEPVFPEMKKRDISISFDFSTTYENEGYMEKVCPYASVVLLSCAGKTEHQTKEYLKKAYDLGTHICIATSGTNGSLCFDGNEFYHENIDYRDHIVDTMGAGDAFFSAFLVHMLRINKESPKASIEWIPEALRYASKYAADRCMVCGSFGYGKKF